MLQVCEIFYSIQGEGKLLGMPSLFIRFSGCNLRCVYCDTPYASWNPEWDEYTIAGLMERLKSWHDCRYVVITGGEPTIVQEMQEITKELKKSKKHITIETNGTHFDKGIAVDLISISPKLKHSTPVGTSFAASHDCQRLNMESIREWIHHADYQLKFVVSQPEDIQEVSDIAHKLNVPADHVLLMGMGTDQQELQKKAGWIVTECLKYGYRFTPRIHLELFGNKRGV